MVMMIAPIKFREMLKNAHLIETEFEVYTVTEMTDDFIFIGEKHESDRFKLDFVNMINISYDSHNFEFFIDSHKVGPISQRRFKLLNVMEISGV